LTSIQKELEDGYSVSSSELAPMGSERFEEAIFTSSGDEIRAGITTKGPCYEIGHSVWDSCLCLGLPVLSLYDSAIAAIASWLS